MYYINEFLKKKRPETFMDYNPGEIPKKNSTTAGAIYESPAKTTTVTTTKTQTRDPFLEGFYSTEDKPETERKTYLQHRTPAVEKVSIEIKKPESVKLPYRPSVQGQAKTTKLPYIPAQDGAPQMTQYGKQTAPVYDSPVKIVGDNVTKKDYDDFWEAFRKESTADKLNWATNIAKPQNTERRQYVTDENRKTIKPEMDSSKMYEDDFWGQFGASYQESKMKQDADEARYRYYKNPTPENKKHFEDLKIELDNFRKNNTEVLADDASLPLISQGLAKITPEIVDNLKNNLVHPGAIGAVVNAKDTFEDAELYFMDKHYARNDNNGDIPQHISELPEDWYREYKDYCHQFDVPGRDNQKYVSPDGKREVIMDTNGYIVTDDENEGTYNYYSAQTDKVGHFFYDMLPWYLWGNTPEDETTKLERILSTFQIYTDGY